MLDFINNPDKVRRRAFKKASHPVMIKYFSSPFASKKSRWDQLEIVSLDFETTGLDPEQHQILSYGKVHIQNGAIKLTTAGHELVMAETSIPESSAVIHHITDDRASEGRPLQQVLPELLEILAGRIMLVHFNKIEQGFLNAACQRLYGSPFIIPTIDTLALAERVLRRRNHTITPNQLRLFNLRDYFKLPVYKAHNALCDALTTAELLMALEAEITPNGSSGIKELLL